MVYGKTKGWLETQMAPATGKPVMYTTKAAAKKRAKALRKKGVTAYVRRGWMRSLPEINWGVWRRD